MIDKIMLESVLDMDNEDFSEILEALSDNEIDDLCEALENIDSNSDLIDTSAETAKALEDVMAIMHQMSDDDLINALESLSDEELDFIMANESLFNKTGNDNIQSKVSSLANKIRSFGSRKTTSKSNNEDPVADIRAQQNEIARKVMEAKKRGEELKSAHSY